MPVAPMLRLLLLPAVGAFYNEEITPAQLPLSDDGVFRAEAGAIEGSAALEKEVALLRSRVGSALESEQQLEATNANLRQEVKGWEDVGARVMNREVQMVNAIRQSQDTDKSALRAAIVAGLSNTKPALALTDASSETRSGVHLPPSLVSWQFLVLVFTVLAAGAFFLIRGPATFSSMLSGVKLFELSELQLEGVPIGFGEGYMLINPTEGLRSRTRVAEQMEDSSVLRFQNDVMTVPIRKGDPCVITIYRRDEVQDVRVGSVILETSDLLRSGSDASCPYFKFKVKGEAELVRHQVYVALRSRQLPGISTKNTMLATHGKMHGKSAAFAV